MACGIGSGCKHVQCSGIRKGYQALGGLRAAAALRLLHLCSHTDTTCCCWHCRGTPNGTWGIRVSGCWDVLITNFRWGEGGGLVCEWQGGGGRGGLALALMCVAHPRCTAVLHVHKLILS